MPWQLELRDGKHCVVKKGESSPVPGGCHDSRADAIKHQRALYANESRVASMYAELDAQPDEIVEIPDVESPLESFPPASSRVVKIEIPTDEALTASVMQQMERMSERQARTDQALVAALQAIGEREHVVNVHSSPITVEPPTVNVEAPNVTVESPTVNVEPAQITVAAPDVTVRPNIVMPSVSKTVTFERDPLTGQVERAEVTES